MDDPVVFGRIVQDARERAGLSQSELAARVGIHRPQISKIESGAKGPSYATLVAIARELDLDLNLLKGGEPDEATPA